MKKFTQKIVSLLALACLLLNVSMVLTPALVSADSKAEICKGVGLTGGSCSASTSETDIGNLAKDIINILSIVVGIAAVLMIIIGGLRYILSNGDSGATSGAKNTIIYALVGLTVVALSQGIVHFVLGKIK